MARSAAAKKVARAASTGAGGKGAGSERNILFPAAMTLVALLGVILVFVARDQRSDLAPAGDPGIDDHWHSAYNIFLCDSPLPVQFPDDSVDDRTGIHTHGDGLIHIHPFISPVTGQYATLGAFFNENQTVFNDDSIEMPGPDGDLLREDSDICGEETELRVLKWNAVFAEKPVVFTENLKDVRLDANGQLFVFALVDKNKKNEDIPKPDSTYLLEYLNLPDVLKPLAEAGEDEVGPNLPTNEGPSETEEPAEAILESDQPTD